MTDLAAPDARPMAFGVGVPVHEAALTNSVCSAADLLLPPGRGRITLCLDEVELGLGRPDVLLLSISRAALLARARHGLRLDTLTEARVLASALGEGSHGYSEKHASAVRRRLNALGWMRADASRRVIGDSLLVEAKVRDWRKGLHQLSRTRWAAHRSALLVPEGVQRLVSRRSLTHLGVGLLVTSAGGQLRWQIQTRTRPLSLGADLWLGELAIRSLGSR